MKHHQRDSKTHFSGCSQCEDKTMSKMDQRNTKEKNWRGQRLWNLRNIIQQVNMHTMAVFEGEKRERGRETIWRNNGWKLKSYERHKTQQTPSRVTQTDPCWDIWKSNVKSQSQRENFFFLKKLMFFNWRIITLLSQRENFARSERQRLVTYKKSWVRGLDFSSKPWRSEGSGL